MAAGLPRARGDGPRDPHYRVTFRRASPRSRGWTRRAGLRVYLCGGFPALAGMDPSSWRRPAKATGLPRARGDGPAERPGPHRAPGASPRSRGWTRRSRPTRPPGRGFPALAGMDPWWCSAARSTPGASPRSRGWTHGGSHARPAGGGFPALAGMDPHRAQPGRTHRWLPRARGDGPPASRKAASQPKASPRSRGWTPVDSSNLRDYQGFPALAGMDP